LVAIYIDNDAKPSIEMGFGALLSGSSGRFVVPFALDAAGGRNLYFPIAFRRSCRVTLTGPARTYYQIDYRRYPAGTALERFGPESLNAVDEVQTRVGRLLAEPDNLEAPRGVTQLFELSSDDPNSAVVLHADHGDVFCQLRFLTGNVTGDLLRTTLLSISFDGTETVHVPLGDFFASGLGSSAISSIPIGTSADGSMTSRWPMPFEHEARLALESTDTGTLEAQLEVTRCPQAWTDRSMYFNAQWHAPETFPSKPPRDWNMATITGDGIYVGNVLNVLNRNEGWWGEGDEKIYVDGESFPSHWGTGTEDYYGYAWCSNERFSLPYIGQPQASERRNFGYTTLYRFHILDSIPFRNSLRFDMEVRHWGDAVDVTYDSVSFWYARPGSKMDGTPAERTAFRIPPLDTNPPDIAAAKYTCGG
jgi:hypothetical protein